MRASEATGRKCRDLHDEINAAALKEAQRAVQVRAIKSVAENQKSESARGDTRWNVLITVLLAIATVARARLPFANAISTDKSKRKGNRQFQHVHTLPACCRPPRGTRLCADSW